MTYSRLYRPNSLDTYVGNSLVKDTVRNFIRNGKYHQTILLSGITGCGKTTMARIIMREYECIGREPGGDACGNCEMCKYFDEYIKTGITDDLRDVNEINVAEQSGKASVTEILDDRFFPPMDLKYKYFLFDEVHKASSALQNYLLKPLEEPEDHVVYMAATTDVDMLIEPLRNRFTMKLAITRPSEADIVPLLGGILKSEDISFEPEALRMISAASDYVIRDCLNNMQQIVDSRGACKSDDVSKVLQIANDNIMFDFLNAYVNVDLIRYATVLHRIRTELSFDSFIKTLRNFVTRGIYIINVVSLEGITRDELKRYKSLFGSFDVNQLSYLLSNLLSMSGSTAEAQFLNLIYQAESKTRTYDNSNALASAPTKKTSERQARQESLHLKDERKKEETAKTLQRKMQGTSLTNNLDRFVVGVVKP